MPLNPPLTHLQRHRISGGWGLGREPPGADVDALWDGLWVRLAQAQVHQEAAREWLEHGLAARVTVGLHARAVLPGGGLTEPHFPRL